MAAERCCIGSSADAARREHALQWRSQEAEDGESTMRVDRSSQEVGECDVNVSVIAWKFVAS